MGQPFRAAGATVTLSATTSSSRVELLADATAVRVVNLGTVATHLAFGGSAVAATTADLVLGPNESATLFKGAAAYVAARTATGTASVYVTPGEVSL